MTNSKDPQSCQLFSRTPSHLCVTSLEISLDPALILAHTVPGEHILGSAQLLDCPIIPFATLPHHWLRIASLLPSNPEITFTSSQVKVQMHTRRLYLQHPK